MIDEVAEEMAAEKYGSAIVLDRGAIAGIFTTTDALRALASIARASGREPHLRRSGESVQEASLPPAAPAARARAPSSSGAGADRAGADRASAGFHRVLIATDFGECSGQVIEVGVDLARRFGASVVVMHATEPRAALTERAVEPATTDAVEAADRRRLEELATSIRKEGTHAEAVLRSGPASESILRAIDATQADAVVIGTHGRHGLSRALLGSVAERVVHGASVPVMTVRAP